MDSKAEEGTSAEVVRFPRDNAALGRQQSPSRLSGFQLWPPNAAMWEIQYGRHIWVDRSTRVVWSHDLLHTICQNMHYLQDSTSIDQYYNTFTQSFVLVPKASIWLLCIWTMWHHMNKRLLGDISIFIHIWSKTCGRTFPWTVHVHMLEQLKHCIIKDMYVIINVS